jgi:hypothetical protein
MSSLYTLLIENVFYTLIDNYEKKQLDLKNAINKKIVNYIEIIKNQLFILEKNNYSVIRIKTTKELYLFYIYKKEIVDSEIDLLDDFNNSTEILKIFITMIAKYYLSKSKYLYLNIDFQTNTIPIYVKINDDSNYLSNTYDGDTICILYYDKYNIKDIQIYCASLNYAFGIEKINYQLVNINSDIITTDIITTDNKDDLSSECFFYK